MTDKIRWKQGIPYKAAAIGGTATYAESVSAAQLPASLGQKTAAESTSFVLASDQPASVIGDGLSVQATLTVTNGAYTAQDVVGGLITFPLAVRDNGKESILNSLTLIGMTSAIAFELWFFNADLATPIADNGAFALAAADQLKVLGVMPITTDLQYQAGAGGVYAFSQGAWGRQLKAAAGTRSIYAYLKHLSTTSPGTTTLYMTAKYEYIS